MHKTTSRWYFYARTFPNDAHTQSVVWTESVVRCDVSRSCNKASQSDYVEFSNFNVELTDRKMPRYCGTTDNLPRKTVGSDGNFFRVTFHSNHVYDSTGFEAFYQFRRAEGKICLNRAITLVTLVTNVSPETWGEEIGQDVSPTRPIRGSGRALWVIPVRKRFYCILISADRLRWQQMTANSSHFHPEKLGYGPKSES